MLNAMSIAPPTVEEHHASPLSKLITFAVNDCGLVAPLLKSL